MTSAGQQFSDVTLVLGDDKCRSAVLWCHSSFRRWQLDVSSSDHVPPQLSRVVDLCRVIFTWREYWTLFPPCSFLSTVGDFPSSCPAHEVHTQWPGITHATCVMCNIWGWPTPLVGQPPICKAHSPNLDPALTHLYSPGARSGTASSASNTPDRVGDRHRIDTWSSQTLWVWEGALAPRGSSFTNAKL